MFVGKDVDVRVGFWHKLLICMCFGGGRKTKGAMDFSVGKCLPSNSFISSS